ncbi:adenosine deaminase [Rothia sp. ZJ1223]|uniref:adenosine deaminase n=1 Tax=Rothia sp. ZJ1223 TaxID=2811098 RepID=UPI001956293D|nr:adenosine deaminase [Rothia sp. ZJ1223]MBM7051457.1 adenosine deaminase [Rothia sp. ZJ1223]
MTASAPAPDYAWIEQLPKVSLHDHLDGGVHPQTIVDIAAEIGHALPAQNADDLKAWFEDNANSRSLASYLETFKHTLAVMQRREDLVRIAGEHALELAFDGVLYGEVRWAPELHTAGGLSMQEAVEAVAEGFAQGAAMASQRLRKPVMVRQILCAMRQKNNSLAVAQLAVANRALGVVGFDIAGPEKEFSLQNHREALDYATQHFLPVTLHAGEAASLDSIQEAVIDGRALRLGHGVQITDDITITTLGEANPEAVTEDLDADQEVMKLGNLAAWIKDRQITLEICPCSNLQTDAAALLTDIGRLPLEQQKRARDYASHPVAMLYRSGFAVTISPDNRLMSSTSVTTEFIKLHENFGFDWPDFFQLTLNAVDGSFMPVDQKHSLRGILQDYYSTFAQAQEDLPEESA